MEDSLEGRATREEAVTVQISIGSSPPSSFSLPVDLVVEILTKLPVKSLIRFSSVDKSWYAIIKNPSFIHSHAKSNNFMTWDDHYFAVDVYSKAKYISKFPHGIYEILLPHNVRKPPEPVRVAGYCHGIFCFYWWSMSDADNWMPIFALCNPATNEFRVLPESRLGLPPYKMLEDAQAGFGFDPTAKDYKVIKLVNFVGNPERIDAVEIYSLSSDTWRVVDVFEHNVQFYGMDHFGKHTDDGFYHWFLYPYSGGGDDLDGHSNETLVLVSFDFGNEVFRVTQLPEKYTASRKKPSTKKYTGYSVSALHDEKLTVVFSFCEPAGATTFEIYELDGDSWSHILSVERVPYNHCTLGFWKTDELLVLRLLPHRNFMHSIYSADECELVRGGHPFLYNVVTKQYRDLYVSREVNHIYKESLVSTKGGACEGYCIFKCL